nr:uncharacterized protein LOC125183819 [Anser cygnoides]
MISTGPSHVLEINRTSAPACKSTLLKKPTSPNKVHRRDTLASARKSHVAVLRGGIKGDRVAPCSCFKHAFLLPGSPLSRNANKPEGNRKESVSKQKPVGNAVTARKIYVCAYRCRVRPYVPIPCVCGLSARRRLRGGHPACVASPWGGASASRPIAFTDTEHEIHSFGLLRMLPCCTTGTSGAHSDNDATHPEPRRAKQPAPRRCQKTLIFHQQPVVPPCVFTHEFQTLGFQ